MLVDVVPMRKNGNPLPKDELRAAVAVRGRLTVSAAGVAELETAGAAFSEMALPRLYRVRLQSLRGNEFVLHGIEPHPRRTGDDALTEGTPQAWWCRLVNRRGHPPPG